MNALITSISTPFEGLFAISEFGLLSILLIASMVASIKTVFTKDK